MTPTTSVPGVVALEQLDRAVEEGLGRGNVDIPSLEGDCQDRACWIDRARERGSTHVLLPFVEQSGPDHLLRIEVVDVASSAVVVITDEVCEICGEDEIIATTADVAAELIPRLQRLEGEPAQLVVSGRPKGAIVEIDGHQVGTLPWAGEVAPGEHTLRVSREGYVVVRRSIVTSSGVQELVDLDLQPQPTGADPARRTRRVAVSSSLIALGVVGVATGAGLFALDGQPYRRDCAPEEVDVNGRCPRMYESTAPAVASVVVGGAALIA
ncbi:MAG: PEGA domain-containing protein, partial [Myxococcota bacterium]